jgi:hypothetical protein
MSAVNVGGRPNRPNKKNSNKKNSKRHRLLLVLGVALGIFFLPNVGVISFLQGKWQGYCRNLVADPQEAAKDFNILVCKGIWVADSERFASDLASVNRLAPGNQKTP